MKNINEYKTKIVDGILNIKTVYGLLAFGILITLDKEVLLALLIVTIIVSIVYMKKERKNEPCK